MRHSVLLGRHSTERRGSQTALKGQVACAALVIALLAPFVVPIGANAAEKGQQLHFGVDMARRGLWSEALFRFNRANLEDPGNPRILNNLAVAHEAVGQFDEAMDLYKRAVELDPANAEMKRNYARFVEFYQGFRPRAEDAEGEKPEGEETETEKVAEPQSDEAFKSGDSEAEGLETGSEG
jgi:tetratricopeptide (TPR) repeat protein